MSFQMKNLQELVNINSYELYAEKTRQMGYPEVADEMQKLISRSKKSENESDSKKPIIPIFYDNFRGRFNKNNAVHRFLIKGRFLSLKIKSFFQQDDISRIQKEIGIGKALFDQDKFDKLSNEFGSPKNQIFLPIILDNFRIENTNYFQANKYINFIRIIIKVQNALSMIYKSDPFIEKRITEITLTKFVENYTQTLEKLSKFADNFSWFLEYYGQIVIARFMFQFSSIHDFKIDTRTFITSNLFYNLIELDSSPNNKENPFQPHEIIHIYNLYVGLDTDGVGLLTAENMKKFENYEFSDAFLKRLFDIISLQEQTFDFYQFILLYFQLRNMTSRPGTQFFFEVLDLDGDGVISRNDINYFYKAIVTETNVKNHDYDAFLSKILDIISCQSEFVTEEDLLDSENQELFFKLLIDLNTFKDWEQQSDDGCDDDEEEYEEEEEEERRGN
ncbi:EF hand family protein [Tritrichomonas foetus]|uniref:EF hand family protein n=1 Tax=Tritrichomonas foetus TaxID=1144522 RepID=A0A1J4JVT9_9EUKA|nr:EF hand family protein [Tritrichomonas foetus]|eukprot:OHT01646.1 EF hand family protein [Tritrichomonas foetus]